ncbi:MAG TPA: glycosyltransferase family 2 protein [Verrucomicrobiae bacterium]|nr:glycosyltransferase family 2 protein [Verrucomicrobiae bacterium]
MNPEMELSVVAPCHNEAGNLRPLTAAVRAALEPLATRYEIVLVDDGSTDDSWETMRQLGAADPHIRALRFAFNCGQSGALWAGMKAARGRIIITLDADMQNPPAEIPKLLAALKQADCVCASRVAARAQGDSWVRIASSRIANWVRNKVSGETISDAGCCFRAFRRECIADIRFFKGAHRFLPTLIKMDGFTVTEVPVGHHPRHAGRAHYGVWNRLFKSSSDLLAVRWMKTRAIRYKIAETVNEPENGP